MNKIILSGLLLTVSNVALAEPTYLDCFTVNEENQKSTYSIKLDESTGKITHTHKNGSAFNSEGFFNANSIRYKNVSNTGGLLIMDTYEINRNTLGFSRHLETEPVNPEFLEAVPRQTIMNVTGQCDIVKVNNRKI